MADKLVVIYGTRKGKWVWKEWVVDVDFLRLLEIHDAGGLKEYSSRRRGRKEVDVDVALCL